MLNQQALADYCQQLLRSDQFTDYAPNGLQVAGKSSIQRIATAVTASQFVIQQAIANQADALLVHHGYFWRGEDPRIIGNKQRRLQALLQHNINLFAYHLPLDAHSELGNNAQLAQRLGFSVTGQWGEQDVGLSGELPSAMSLAQLGQHIEQGLQRQPLLIGGHTRPIKRLAWCTGAAQDMLEQVASLGIDTYISGEVSERTYHSAKELGVNYIAAGHHATERYGIQALGQHLAQQFSIPCQFIDESNPV